MLLVSLQVLAIVGMLSDDTDPMVSVMKLEKAPQDSFADIGGLDTQIQEIKVKDAMLSSCKGGHIFLIAQIKSHSWIVFCLEDINENIPDYGNHN